MEEFTTSVGRVLGLTLDLSLAHTSEGSRIIDVVKRQLIQFVKTTMEGEDLFYLYHPELVDPVFDIGQIVSVIGNYETDGWVFDLRYALKLTYYVVDAQDDDAEKMILYVTDRIQDGVAIDKLMTTMEREDSECNLFFVGIGSRYNKDLLDIDGVKYIHLNDPAKLGDVLLGKG